MLSRERPTILGNLALELSAAVAKRRAAGHEGSARGTPLASGHGWSVSDVVCTSGPGGRAFEEQHDKIAVAVVIAGSFQYRTSHGVHLMSPGSLMLGSPDQCYECGHDHAAGDRCISFRFTPEWFASVAGDAGARRDGFAASRIPPMRSSTAIVATLASAIAHGEMLSWEETALDLAAIASRAADEKAKRMAPPSARAVAGVTAIVRAIEADPVRQRPLEELATGAGQSPFHFLRVFRQLTGVTPHQFVLRARLREAAGRLRASDQRIIDVALASGFNDLSNFNHAFRAEFGVAPRMYRSMRRARFIWEWETPSTGPTASR